MNVSFIGSEEGSFEFLVDEHRWKRSKVGMARFKNGKIKKKKKKKKKKLSILINYASSYHASFAQISER